ncbi:MULTISPECIES: hypothetical protein [Delftia]|uniref:Uncharacterized protein n=1 Tax=Delftia lacustris TaxID=558537 RepID=A0A1H3SH02_9BURK|nr:MULTISPECIES: hypothetical protein [Delftia]EPD43232.1 hypothetical protein HMPREF9701_00934 [Delftia acidovorans CCUG 274B]SDZ37017.1 hypothetical protein SAMN05421547_12030 [Delftia lacustris]
MNFKSTSLRLVATSTVFAASLLVAPVAFAHGDAQPQHGGIVSSASELSFELVAAADGAALYVVDHDRPFDTSGMVGKLTVLNGAEKAETVLKSAGGNKLEAQGVKLAKGAKVVAVLQTADKKTVTVRFAVK